MTVLEHALQLWGLGLSIIPVPRPQPGAPAGQAGDGKVPTIPWRPYQTQPPDEQQVKEWFGGEPMNIAILTGAVSGIVAIDADTPEAVRAATRRFPYTPWQTL